MGGEKQRIYGLTDWINLRLLFKAVLLGALLIPSLFISDARAQGQMCQCTSGPDAGQHGCAPDCSSFCAGGSYISGSSPTCHAVTPPPIDNVKETGVPYGVCMSDAQEATLRKDHPGAIRVGYWNSPDIKDTAVDLHLSFPAGKRLLGVECGVLKEGEHKVNGVVYPWYTAEEVAQHPELHLHESQALHGCEWRAKCDTWIDYVNFGLWRRLSPTEALLQFGNWSKGTPGYGFAWAYVE